MIRGYARVSTLDQSLEGQLLQLEGAGVELVYEEHAGGGSRRRPELERLLKELERGDELVVCKLDRLARSLSDLLELFQELDRAGVGFRSLGDALDLGTPTGRLMMHVVGAFAEFERALVRERTLAGLEAAKVRGVTLGRRRSLSADQVRHVQRMLEQGGTQAEAARLFGVSRSTVCRALRRA